MYEYPSSTSIMAPVQHGKITIELTKTLTTQSPQEPDIVKTTSGADTLKEHIYELHPTNKTIPIFALPLPFHTNVSHKTGDKLGLCVDVRGVSRVTPSGDVIINNPTDYRFLMDLALLTEHWVQEEQSSPIIKNNKVLLCKLFVRWIGGMIISRLNIEPELQPKVNAIVAYYWLCMSGSVHSDDDMSNDSVVQPLARVISDATGGLTLDIMETIRTLEYMSKIDDLINGLKQRSGSLRFDDMTAGFLFTLVQYSWYGSNPAILCATALEFPPFFLVMIYHAATKDGFSKTQIGRLLKDMQRSATGSYVKSYDHEIYK